MNCITYANSGKGGVALVRGLGLQKQEVPCDWMACFSGRAKSWVSAEEVALVLDRTGTALKL